MISIFIAILTPLHVVISLLIILIVLMQRPKSEGLGAAFGGGVIESFAGVQTTNVLQTATRYLGGLLFAITLILAVLHSRQSHLTKGAFTSKLLSEPKPAATASPVPGASVAPTASPVASAAPVESATPAASPEASATVAPAASVTPAPQASATPAAAPTASGTAK